MNFEGSSSSSNSAAKGKDRDFEKFINSWKIPKILKDPIFGQKSWWNLFKTDDTIKTEEREVPLSQDFETIKLLSHELLFEHKKKYTCIYLGMVQVGVKPLTKEGLNTAVCVAIRDTRFAKFTDTILGLVEASLCNGPISFEIFPDHALPLDHPCFLALQVKIHNYKMVDGLIPVALIYRVRYKFLRPFCFFESLSNYEPTPPRTTPFNQTDLSKAHRIISRSTSWSEVSLPDEWTTEERQNPSLHGLSQSEDGRIWITL